MNTRFLENSEYEKWDKFVDSSPQGYIFDYSWWLIITTNSDFKICAVFNDDEIIMAGMPLPFYSKKKIHMPLVSQSLGVLFCDLAKINNMRLQKQLTLQKEYTKLIFDFIQPHIKSFWLNFNYNYDWWSPLYWLKCVQTTRYTYIIDYNNYILDEEFSHFSKGHKWIINKVEKKSDLKVYETTDVEEYLKESDKTYARQHVKKPYSNDLIRKLHSELQKRHMGTILKIIDTNGNIHAISYYLNNGKEIYYWLGASDATLRNSGGHTYLTWYAIKYFADKSNRFNFGGSMLEDVDKNFRNFSAIPYPYYAISFNPKSSILFHIKQIIKIIIKK